MDIYWKSHSTTSGSGSPQYRAAVFYHNEEQRKLAEEYRDRISSETGRRVVTAIEPYSGFHMAEDYHQKHSLRLFPELMAELKAIYPDMKNFLNSVAVTRINGYLGGYGTCNALQREIEGFGLSRKGIERLISVVCGRKASVTCPVQ